MFNKTPKLARRPESLQTEVPYKLIIGINYATALCKEGEKKSIGILSMAADLFYIQGLGGN